MRYIVDVVQGRIPPISNDKTIQELLKENTSQRHKDGWELLEANSSIALSAGNTTVVTTLRYRKDEEQAVIS